jgi:filamentous hemagglutinin family protein
MRFRSPTAVEAAVSAAETPCKLRGKVDMKNTAVFRLPIVALITLCVHPLFGGVVLDGSFGTHGTLPGPNFMIQSSFGKQVGGNLFQSFSQFNLNNTQSATFSGPNNVHNILARVTSGSPSSIDGTINSSIPGANLFLLNPAGVMFGQNAEINVSGSFAVSTANYLKLADGGKFNTSLGGGDVLTSAPVTAFGFLNSAPASVSITGSGFTRDELGNPVPGPGLIGAAGKSFSVVAGDLTMSGAQVLGEGSRVNLVSVKSAGEVQLDATNIKSAVDLSQFTALGTISLTNLALIDTRGPGGGPVVIRGGNLYMNNSQIYSGTTGAIQGGAIDIALVAGVNMANFAGIVTDAFGAGDAGDVTMTANSLVMDDAFVQTFTYGSGNAGNVTLVADSLRQHLSQVSSVTNASGNAGNITLTANSLVIHSSFVFGQSQGESEESGNSGNITLTADSLIIGDFGYISNSAIGSSGNAGNITLTADSLVLDNHGLILAETSGSGNAGNITLTANSLLIQDFSKVSSNTFDGRGNGRNISVQASDLTLRSGGQLSARTRFGSGNGGNVNVIADSFLIDGSSMPFATGIFANSVYSSGDAGNVTVHAGDLTMIGGGEIGSGTFFGTGKGGNVNIIADSLLIDGTREPDTPGALIFADSVSEAFYYGSGTNTSGTAGNVMVRAGSLTLTTGGQISSNTSGSGNGGNVNVIADSLLVTGAGRPLPDFFSSSGILATAQVGSSGKAGNVMVQADNLTISDTAQISSSTFGKGDGGTVKVTADSLLVEGADSGIFATAEAKSAGKSGDVVVGAGSLSLQNGGEISTASFTAAAAGSVQLSLGVLTMDSGSSISSANTSSGEAGSVTIDAIGLIQLSGGSSVSTSAIDGGAGTVSLNAPDVRIASGGEISSSTFGLGNGGNVNIHAGSLSIDGSATPGFATGVFVASFGRGEAGSVSIRTTGPVKLKHGATISTSSEITDAGFIDITSGGKIKLKDQSNITVSAGRNGGDIHLTTPELVYLLDSSITATAGGIGGSGTGGNIRIDPTFIVLNNSLISANAAAGQGGNISLVSDFLFNSDLSNNNITATGTTNGTVNITAPALDLGSELITLPVSLLSAESQLQERCTALLRGDFSSFISIGRGGTEPAPEELQSTF